MSFQYDYNKIRDEFGVVFEPSPKISQLGGLRAITKFLEKGNFRKRMADEFGEEKSRSVLQLMIGIIAGASDMVTVGKIGQDPVVRDFLKRPVQEAQLGRDFRSFTRVELEKFHEFVISIAILCLTREVGQGEALIFDVDATSVEKYGSQEGVEVGYIDRDKLESCYQYLLFRLHNLNLFFYGTVRAGSSHSQNGWCEYLKRFLPLFKGQWRTVWRADSGYHNEAAFELFSENDATFHIKSPIGQARLELVMLTDSLWKKDPKNENIDYCSIHTNTTKGTLVREVYKRKRSNEDQFLLDGSNGYRYDCISTNDFVKDESEVFAFYNGRAHIENNIRELKYDYALGKIVTESFDANDAITQTTILTYLLVSHFKSQFLPKKMVKHQLSTLRNYLFNIPGRLVYQARKLYFKIHNIFAGAHTYARIFYRLKHHTSWVLEPPAIAI